MASLMESIFPSLAFVALACGWAMLCPLHITVTKSDLSAGLAKLREFWRREGKRNIDERLEQELRRTKAQKLRVASKFLVHVSFFMCFVVAWKLLQKPSLTAVVQFIAVVMSYPLFALAESMSGKDECSGYVEAIYVSCQAMWAVSVATEPDFMVFCCLEKNVSVGLILMSMVFIDLKVMLPLYLCEASLLIANQWRLMGASNLSFLTIYSSIVGHLFGAAAIVFVDHTMRSMIAAKVDSSDASSLMLGFRQVLRGVCDGDLLLDRSSCTIVDDASCLERLLKSSRKLETTNFLDLFLDSGSRAGFLQFIKTQVNASTDSYAPRMPSGLRISLQGADGPVSVDVFQTNVPNQKGTGIDYCLLALKEDPEQSCPPDALPNSAPPINAAAQSRSQDRTGSSVSEVVEAYEELVEFALLVSNETSVFDIKEVHLCFRRNPFVPALDSGMPTLKRFIRPTDWHRIETMLENLKNLRPSEMQQRCTFRHPMLFRLPGESRSYLCSRLTSMYLAHEVVPDRPVHFWMNLSSFDTSHIRRPRARNLEGIGEE